MKKPTAIRTMVQHIIANGPSTRKELLTAAGKDTRPGYFSSYFRTFEVTGKQHVNPKYLQTSLVARGILKVIGKNAKNEKVYGLGMWAGWIIRK